MNRFSRRRTLAAAGCAVSGALAGCLDDSSASDDGSNDDDTEPSDGDSTDPLEAAVTAEAVVDYPGFIDDDVAVDEDSGRVEYAEPETEFQLAVLFEGDDPADDDIRVSRDLSGDAMTAFLAPAFDGDEFTYHVFANGAFVEYADWRAISAEEDALVDEGRATFDELEDGVYHLTVTPESDANVVVIADGDREALEAADSEVTRVGIARSVAGDSEEPRPPEAAFRIDFVDETTVEITHTSGDHLETAHVSVELDGERIENPFGVETVTAGDTATIDDVPDGGELEVIYDDGERSAVLASAEIR